MSDTVIKVEHLGKTYLIRHQQRERYTALRDVLTNKFKSFGKRLISLQPRSSNLQPSREEFWALKDVSFEVKQGDRVGIIGRNGAGKTTLLKILSRITEPTAGRIAIKGRVASLLEVGTGFHPELTGRENIFLNGAILGMSKSEIKEKFDEIVNFAEIEKFLDTPVKRYSSGMYVRLAFAVAAHLEPEILLVDEVLAVGDAAFQKKCLGKMEDVSTKEGRTVLFVSHNMGAITRLCQRSIWVDEGKVVLNGLTSDVVGRYQSQYLTACAEWKRPELDKVDSDFAFLRIKVTNCEGCIRSLFGGDEPVSVEIHYIVRRHLSGCQIGTRVYNHEGLVIFTTSDADNFSVSALPKEQGQYRALFTIPGGFLAPGTYYLLIAAHLPFRSTYEVIEQAVVFEISPSNSLASLDGRLGIITPFVRWDTYKDSVL